MLRLCIVIVVFACLTALPGPVLRHALAQAPANPPAVQEAVPPAKPPVRTPDGAGKGQRVGTPQNPNGSGDDRVLGRSVTVLLQLLVLAVILESALALVFTWRPYLQHVNGRTANPIISFGVALTIVNAFNVDQVGKLLAEYGGSGASPSPDWSTAILTALVVAGGSSGVHRMLRALGYRGQPTEEEQQKPKKNEAWIAVIDERPHPQTRCDVLIDDGQGQWVVLGVLGKNQPPPGFLGWLLRDKRRFPSTGGHTVEPNKPFKIGILPSRSRPATTEPSVIWGPGALADRTILDVRVTEEP